MTEAGDRAQTRLFLGIIIVCMVFLGVAIFFCRWFWTSIRKRLRNCYHCWLGPVSVPLVTLLVDLISILKNQLRQRFGRRSGHTAIERDLERQVAAAPPLNTNLDEEPAVIQDDCHRPSARQEGPADSVSVSKYPGQPHNFDNSGKSVRVSVLSAEGEREGSSAWLQVPSRRQRRPQSAQLYPPTWPVRTTQMPRRGFSE
ncbi:hypothetical protein HRR86_003291 [Exophiala dermatitidis]|nr:hypothetical protein HRR74_002939 [Exophiala dermatitidis]KAJ4529679.1 hypothetical protein HRR73_000707 [Exophiala dermatitidis]KAJ4587810.1 hypothetical protein HRR82_001609 [Exophiala dermatitidis]KAJ4610204.1 hypothetical protein HRR85_005979 [Exophiala dermatitidis]KAJ4628392.1 hypothetical protein HRR86_003291 [Exophiala dermatitidis]